MNQRENARPLCRLINRLLLLIFCTSLVGCALTNETNRVFQMAKRTTHVEPKYFEYIRSDRVAQREARLLAEQAWAEVGLPNASPDYQNGFLEGFSDYLYRGGEGEPPVIPPRGYWNLRFLNQFGKSSVGDWYEGFRQGAQDCKSRGLREMWVVPTSLIVEPEKPYTPSNWSDDEDMWQEKNYKQEKKLERLRDPESPPVPGLDDGGAASGSDGMGEDDGSPMPSDTGNERPDPFRDDRQDEPQENEVRIRENLPNDDPADGNGFADDDNERRDPFDDMQANEPEVAPANEPGNAFDMEELFQDGGPEAGGGAELEDFQPTTDDDPFSRLDPFRRGDLTRSNSSNRTVRQTSGYESLQRGLRAASAKSVNKLRPRVTNTQRATQRSRSSVPSRQRSTSTQTSNNTRNARNIPRGQEQPFYSRELMIMDSVPAIPLEVTETRSNQPSNAPTSSNDEVIVWDPMEGVDEPPDFDADEFDNLFSDQTIDDSTKWTPAMTRATELPPRIADRRMRVAPKTSNVQVVDRPKFVPNSSSKLQLRDQLRMALDSSKAEKRTALPPIVDGRNTQPIRDGNAIQFRINDTE